MTMRSLGDIMVANHVTNCVNVKFVVFRAGPDRVFPKAT